MFRNFQLEDSLVGLSDRGLVNVRIDSVGGVVELTPENERQLTYERFERLEFYKTKQICSRVIEVAEDAVEHAESTLFKALLGQVFRLFERLSF